ncbi:MarR family transcriptional regulator [Pseudoalteromonas phenolica]|uniref:MarR family transcriptional regulator n=1 Tax=Pseudoalteromonas phenolica TaxID=161398 RepID=A0A5R9Q7M4_9GAMM|nr:MarR family transcriptional regulator [Pseudoalteromonas phenolica]TLX48279.1 MarR family transcriptional regulator [Pseudoalteromonas phenolica]
MLDITEFLPYQLVHLANKVSDDFANVYKEQADLTTPQWRVMAHLAQSSFTAKQLIELARIDKSTISRAIKQLESRGLVELRADEKDKRSKVLFLTKEGREIYKKLSVSATAWEKSMLKNLSEEERVILKAVLHKLNEHI